MPLLEAGLKVDPSRPAKAAVSRIFGFCETTLRICSTAASVRSSEEPGGSWMTPIRKPWSWSGMKPVGVAFSRQTVSPSRPP